MKKWSTEKDISKGKRKKERKKEKKLAVILLHQRKQLKGEAKLKEPEGGESSGGGVKNSAGERKGRKNGEERKESYQRAETCWQAGKQDRPTGR